MSCAIYLLPLGYLFPCKARKGLGSEHGKGETTCRRQPAAGENTNFCVVSWCFSRFCCVAVLMKAPILVDEVAYDEGPGLALPTFSSKPGSDWRAPARVGSGWREMRVPTGGTGR